VIDEKNNDDVLKKVTWMRRDFDHQATCHFGSSK
jgi:hypothetical protein